MTAADPHAADLGDPAGSTVVPPADGTPPEATVAPSPDDVAAGLAAAAAGLGELGDVPVGEHVARYETVHAALQDALTSIDSV